MKKYYFFINLALVSALAYLASDIFLNHVQKTLNPLPAATNRSVSKNITPQELKPVSYYTIITERNLFNSAPEAAIAKYEQATPPPPPPVDTAKEEDLPLTKLNLKLVGTATGVFISSYAFIEDKNKRKQDLYKIGDIIQEAEIIDIARTKVILRNKGKNEVLFLYEEDQKVKKLQQASASAPAIPAALANASRRNLLGRGARLQTGQAGTTEAPTTQTNMEEGVITISRDEINKNMENLNQFMSQVRLRPYFVEGKPEGFMISQIASGSLIEKIGLSNGDVLKSVNGIAINSPEKAFEVYQQLREETTIMLEIERNKTPQTLTYNVR